MFQYFRPLRSKKPESLKEQADYIARFPRHDFQGFGGDYTFARSVKVWEVHFPDEETRNNFLEIVTGDGEDFEDLFWKLENIDIPNFQQQHPGYTIVRGGRSGGWFTLRTAANYNAVRLPEEDEDIADLFNLLWGFDQWVVNVMNEFVQFCADIHIVPDFVVEYRVRETRIIVPREKENEDV